MANEKPAVSMGGGGGGLIGSALPSCLLGDDGSGCHWLGRGPLNLPAEGELGIEPVVVGGP